MVYKAISLLKIKPDKITIIVLIIKFDFPTVILRYFAITRDNISKPPSEPPRRRTRPQPTAFKTPPKIADSKGSSVQICLIGTINKKNETKLVANIV